MSNGIEVQDVIFLTPAKVTFKLDGESHTLFVNVDIINRKVYDDKSQEYEDLSNAVFGHLDQINNLPEDFFAPQQEVLKEAAEAEEYYQRIKNEAEGEI